MRYIIEDATLTAIGDAIREKTGKADLITPLNMAKEISGIESGGGDIPEEAFKLSGNCNYRFSNNGWNWFINEYKDKITTENLMDCTSMFVSSEGILSLPFEFNFDNNTYHDYSNMFASCKKITTIGKFKNLYPSKLSASFQSCENLRYLPEFENLNLDRMYTDKYASLSGFVSSCYSLRSIPEDLLKRLYTPLATGVYYTIFSSFNHLYSIDEIRGLNPQGDTMTSNIFNSCFTYFSRVKDIIFATNDDGTPYSVNWKSQTIDMTKYTGYSSSKANITAYNSGITADKEVTDDATYQALKDDADWFTLKPEYSRYNKVSAINTINSLPDTSAYLATAGGTNTIKFNGNAGSLTDGGAISDLDEETIALAVSKGWTVTFA